MMETICENGNHWKVTMQLITILKVTILHVTDDYWKLSIKVMNIENYLCNWWLLKTYYKTGTSHLIVIETDIYLLKTHFFCNWPLLKIAILGIPIENWLCNDLF